MSKFIDELAARIDKQLQDDFRASFESLCGVSNGTGTPRVLTSDALQEAAKLLPRPLHEELHCGYAVEGELYRRCVKPAAAATWGELGGLPVVTDKRISPDGWCIYRNGIAEKYHIADIADAAVFLKIEFEIRARKPANLKTRHLPGQIENNYTSERPEE